MPPAIFISFPILLLLKHLINKRLAQFFEKIDKRVLIFTTFILCLCATLIFILASLLDNTQILFKDYILLISFIVVYTLLTIGIIYELLKSIRKSYESAKKVEYLENLNKYTENLEIMYNNLRIFKHDYVNIMASMVGYFEENRYDDLKTFFYDKISAESFVNRLGRASKTKYLILVNRSAHKVAVYQGSKNNWKQIHYWSCSVGKVIKGKSITPAGNFRVSGYKIYRFGAQSRSFYCTVLSSGNMIHSVQYAHGDSSPVHVVDGRLGYHITNSCIRLLVQNAKWVYNNCHEGTAVIVYNP